MNIGCLNKNKDKILTKSVRKKIEINIRYKRKYKTFKRLTGITSSLQIHKKQHIYIIK